jgi:uncharacterized protein YdcH (DUF465 family)
MAAQDATGIESIRHLLERFPENETAVRDLIERDPTFAALCREYRQTEEELQQLEREGDNAAEKTAELRQRHAQIEDELLARIEGYRPL